MREARRRNGIVLAAVFCGFALAAASAAAGEVGPATWPPSFAWHTFHGSADPESGGELAVDGALRVTMIGSSYAAWLGPGGQAPLRAFTPGVANGFVVQVDRLGAYRWHAFLPCSLAGVAADGAGNLYLTGSSGKSWSGPAGEAPLHAHPGGASAIVAAKLDASGTYLWHTFYGSGHATYNNGGNAVAGGVWVTGHTTGGSWSGPAGQPPLAPFVGLQNAFILKLTPAGAYQWHAFFGTGSAEAFAVGVDAAGDGVVLGSTLAAWNGPAGQAPLHAYAATPPRNADLFVVKLRGVDGAYRWHTFYGTGSVSARGLAVLGSDIWVTGSSGAAWTGPSGEAPRSPYMAPPANPNTILVLRLRGDGTYEWHTFLGNGGTAGNAVAADGLSVYLAADCWMAWSGPGGEAPVTPYSGWSSAALVALTPDGAYTGHTFVGASTGAEGLAVRSGVVFVGGTAGEPWAGPDGQPSLHAFTGFGDVMLVKLVSPLPHATVSRRLARRP